jgi:hypothetical protein
LNQYVQEPIKLPVSRSSLSIMKAAMHGNPVHGDFSLSDLCRALS